MIDALFTLAWQLPLTLLGTVVALPELSAQLPSGLGQLALMLVPPVGKQVHAALALQYRRRF